MNIIVIPDVEPEEDWTRRGHRRNLETYQRQGSKIFLIATIESGVETG